MSKSKKSKPQLKMSSLRLQKIKSQALLNIISKEFIQIRRDLRSLIFIIFIPLFLLVIFGYGVTMDIKNVNLVVCDLNKTQLSRLLIQRFTSSGFFNLIAEVDDINRVDYYLISGEAKIGIILPHNFSDEIGAGRTSKIQVILDGSDASIANTVLGYVQQILQEFSSDIIADYVFKKTGKEITGIDLKPRIWFNQELKSVNFFIPGLMGLIMMIMTVFMTSLSISRERELGSFERLISTPVNPFFIIIGKVIPYAMLAFVDSVLILLAGYVLFKLEVKGDLLSLFVATTIFIFCGLNLGLIISTAAKSQQSTMAISFISTIIPTFILSGFVFPIRNMPMPLQILSYIVPARYYIDVIRGIILKGNGISEHINSALFLLLFMILTFRVGSFRLKKLMREV